jgi:hypothetical protein
MANIMKEGIEMEGFEALMEAANKQNEKKKSIVEKGMTCSMDEGCESCSG